MCISRRLRGKYINFFFLMSTDEQWVRLDSLNTRNNVWDLRHCIASHSRDTNYHSAKKKSDTFRKVFITFDTRCTVYGVYELAMRGKRKSKAIQCTCTYIQSWQTLSFCTIGLILALFHSFAFSWRTWLTQQISRLETKLQENSHSLPSLVLLQPCSTRVSQWAQSMAPNDGNDGSKKQLIPVRKFLRIIFRVSLKVLAKQFAISPEYASP